jgi:microcystin degradation protein MlrC
MARIAVGGVHHETNSFIPTRTDFAYFASHRDRPPLVRGPDVLKWLTNTSFGLSGFLEVMADKHEILPLLWTSGGAGGTVTRDAFERITAELVGSLSREMPVDAVYLDLHGAMVTEDFEDGEGELLRRLRAALGPHVPIVISLDYHANVTPRMVECTDGLVGYYTYPHIDREKTGRRAARVLSTILERGQPSGRALRKIPFLIPLNFQSTLVQPSKQIVESSERGEGGDVLNVSPIHRNWPTFAPTRWPMRSRPLKPNSCSRSTAWRKASKRRSVLQRTRAVRLFSPTPRTIRDVAERLIRQACSRS